MTILGHASDKHCRGVVKHDILIRALITSVLFPFVPFNLYQKSPSYSLCKRFIVKWGKDWDCPEFVYFEMKLKASSIHDIGILLLSFVDIRLNNPFSDASSIKKPDVSSLCSEWFMTGSTQTILQAGVFPNPRKSGSVSLWHTSNIRLFNLLIQFYKSQPYNFC